MSSASLGIGHAARYLRSVDARSTLSSVCLQSYSGSFYLIMHAICVTGPTTVLYDWLLCCSIATSSSAKCEKGALLSEFVLHPSGVLASSQEKLASLLLMPAHCGRHNRQKQKLRKIGLSVVGRIGSVTRHSSFPSRAPMHTKCKLVVLRKARKYGILSVRVEMACATL